jgi:hypothetical protein
VHEKRYALGYFSLFLLEIYRRPMPRGSAFSAIKEGAVQGEFGDFRGDGKGANS